MNHEGPEFTAPDDQRCEALLRASKDQLLSDSTLLGVGSVRSCTATQGVVR